MCERLPIVSELSSRLHSHVHFQGAFSLREGDVLAQLLARVAGVERLGYNDSVWRDLLLQYEKLVHLHNLGQGVLSSACQLCSQNCAASSNLATYALHVRSRFAFRIGRMTPLVSNMAVYLEVCENHQGFAGGCGVVRGIMPNFRRVAREATDRTDRQIACYLWSHQSSTNTYT